MKLEVLPIEFLHQLTLRLNGQIELLAIRKDARIVAFASCLHAQSSYYTMYGGLDYHLNHKFDLYFNLVYALLDRGLQKRASTIVFGMGADAAQDQDRVCFRAAIRVRERSWAADVNYRSRRRAFPDRAHACHSSIQHLQKQSRRAFQRERTNAPGILDSARPRFRVALRPRRGSRIDELKRWLSGTLPGRS